MHSGGVPDEMRTKSYVSPGPLAIERRRSRCRRKSFPATTKIEGVDRWIHVPVYNAVPEEGVDSYGSMKGG